jgi:radical SAM superfamily enzyme YgiQ (UPF0313 family)
MDANRKWLLIRLPEPGSALMKQSCIPPIGLWQLRTYLRSIGDSVDILDLHLDNGKAIDLSKYTHVGVSAQFSTQHDYLVSMIDYVHTHSNCNIVVGGFHAKYAEKYIPHMDRVLYVKGAGPEAYGAKPPYLHIHFDESEMDPYWAINKPHDLRSISERWFPFEVSRGCPFSCGFCGVNDYWGGVKVSNDLEERFEYLISKGITEIFIEDDNLFHFHDYFERFSGLCSKYNIKWSTPNGVAIHYLKKYLDSPFINNLWRVSLPFETGLENTAKLMNLWHKFQTFEQAENVVNTLHNRGIQTCGFFIIGYPGETISDITQTLDYANSLPLDERHIYIATPYPGSALYDLCVEHEYLRHDGPDLFRQLGYTNAIIDTPEWSAEDIQEIRKVDREKALAKKASQVSIS